MHGRCQTVGCWDRRYSVVALGLFEPQCRSAALRYAYAYLQGKDVSAGAIYEKELSGLESTLGVSKLEPRAQDVSIARPLRSLAI